MPINAAKRKKNLPPRSGTLTKAISLPNKNATDSCLIVTIFALSTNGMGLARHPDGRVIFVPLALPQEEVQISQPQKTGPIYLSSLIKVIKKSPYRVNPLCPLFGTCGGCQLQHLETFAQTEQRLGFLWHNLKRIGQFNDKQIEDWKPKIQIHNAEHWNYRQRIRLHAKRQNGNWQVGYMAPRSNHIVPFERCYLAKGPLSQGCKILLAWLEENANKFVPKLRTASPETFSAEFELTLDHDSCVFIHMIKSRRGKQQKAKHSSALGEESTTESTTEGEQNILLRHPNPRLSHLSTPLAGFIQPHFRAVDLYTEAIENTLEKHASTLWKKHQNKEQKTLRVWDLFCGSGALSFSASILAKNKYNSADKENFSVHITAVEGIEAATTAAKRNFENFLAKIHTGARDDPFRAMQFSTVTLDVAKYLKQNAKQLADVIVLDPPRTGLGIELSQILAQSQGMVIYVACDSAALARDLPILLSKDMRLTEMHLFDTFAQTTHFECIAVLQAEGELEK